MSINLNSGGKMNEESIRVITEIGEFSELLHIQKSVWGFNDIDIVPANIMRAVSDEMNPNGIVLGYYLNEKIIGFILTFPTSNPKEVLMHMLAVSKKFQCENIGYKLMLELKKILQSQNIDKIFWTYDPLESINANLYIKKIGGIITHYFMDYYGPIKSKIHSGYPTDRFRVEWYINDLKMNKKIRHECDTLELEYINNTDLKYVEIPLNIQEIKNKNMVKAIKYRMKTRKLFYEDIEQNNYIGIDFVYDKIKNKGIYIFNKLNE